MKILFLGDIVSKPGRQIVKEFLPSLILEFNPDIVIANCENLSHGRGVTKEHLQEMKNAGVDYFTGGDHMFYKKDLEDYIDQEPLVRPANYPSLTPGKGHAVINTKNNEKLLIINVLGRTFLNERLDDPFTKVDEILSSYNKTDYDICIVDFHAEATSEKHALAFYLDGRVNAVLGTHTHVPTCDNRVMPKGTMYVSDVGMCGSTDSVLGVDENIIIAMYLTAQNQRFDWKEDGRRALRSVLLDTNEKTIVRLDRNI